MTEAVVPAVIVSNLPSQLSKNGEATCLALLGSKTGQEVGVLFWRVHPSLAKFMVAFKHQEDRDYWYKSSPELKKVTAEFGIRSSMIWFNRESGLVMKKFPTRNINRASRSQKQLQGEVKSNSRMIFQDEFEDLDQMFGVSNTKVECRVEEREEDRISPVEACEEHTEVKEKLIEEIPEDMLTVTKSPLETKTLKTLKEGMNCEEPDFLLPMLDFPNMKKIPAAQGDAEMLIPLTISQLQEALEFQSDCYDEDLEEDKMKVRFNLPNNSDI